jgi:hypothetical protein
MQKILKILTLSLIFLNVKFVAMSDHQKNMIFNRLKSMNFRSLNYHPQFQANLNRVFPEYSAIKETLPHQDFYTGIDYIEQNLAMDYHTHNHNEMMQEKIQNQILLLELDRHYSQNRTAAISQINNAAIQAVLLKLEI